MNFTCVLKKKAMQINYDNLKYLYIKLHTVNNKNAFIKFNRIFYLILVLLGVYTLNLQN